LVYARKLVLVFQEWHSAVFGLEKDLAQRKLSGVVSVIFLAVLLGMGEFGVVSFVIPNHPEIVALPTPTLDLLLTSTVTLPPNFTGLETGTGTPSATEGVAGAESYCIKGKLEITSPKSGDTLSIDAKVVTLLGSVTIPANFGYYKYEYTRAENENWITIQANDSFRCLDKMCMTATGTPIVNATDVPGNILGTWDISQLSAGDYFLRLISTDNDGKALPACQIPIHISVPPTPIP
jgi:hypothetical protein